MLLAFGCSGSSDVTEAEIEATVVARVLATVVAIGGTPIEQSAEPELPIIQPVEIQENTFVNNIFWEGSGNQRTSVFSEADEGFSFKWDYSPPGVNFDDFSIQVIDANTHAPVTISRTEIDTLRRGLAGVYHSGDFYLIVRSNGDWRIEVQVRK